MQRRRPSEIAVSAEDDHAHQGNPNVAALCAECRLRNHAQVSFSPALIETFAFHFKKRFARMGLRHTRRTSNSLAGRNSVPLRRADSASSRFTIGLTLVSLPVPTFTSPVTRPITAATLSAASA